MLHKHIQNVFAIVYLEPTRKAFKDPAELIVAIWRSTLKFTFELRKNKTDTHTSQLSFFIYI